MKNIKKFTAIVLCLLLVTTSFATVSAEKSEFSGIVSKNVKVSANGDVKVLIDIELADTLVIVEDKNITLDLNGNTIAYRANNKNAAINVAAPLTIKDRLHRFKRQGVC